MRNPTRSERIGLLALLTLVTTLAGWAVLSQAGRPPMPPGVTLREALPQAPAGPATVRTLPTAPTVMSASTTTASDPEPPAASPPAEVVVHVAGAVKKPGVYHLRPGARNEDALKAAGGPTAQANTDAVNLAAHVEDGTQLYIPTHKEQPEGGALATATASPATSPVSAAKATKAERTHARSTGRRREGGSKSDKLTDPAQGKININTAGAAELQRLPGIGPTIAARILAFRQEHHGFQTLEDLRNVSGIGERKFAKMEPFLKVR